MAPSYWKSRRRRRIEDGITQAVHDHWRWLRQPDTLVASIPNKFALGQPGLTPGLPDLLVIGPHVPRGIGFIELKTDEGRVSEAQRGFRDLCARLGIACALTRGRDEPIQVLEMWGVVKRSVNDGERVGARDPSRGRARIEAG